MSHIYKRIKEVVNNKIQSNKRKSRSKERENKRIKALRERYIFNILNFITTSHIYKRIKEVVNIKILD